MGRSRPFWVLLLGMGAFVLWAASLLAEPAPDADEFEDSGEFVLAEMRSTGVEGTRRGLVVLGGIFLFAGAFGLIRSFGPRPDDGLSDPVAEARTAADLVVGVAPAPDLGTAPDLAFDPTLWEHPAALFYLFEGRSAGGFYDLVRELRDRRTPGLLVAMLQQLGGPRKMVAVLGSDEAVAAFDRAFQEDVGARVEAGALDWARIRPDLQLQKESYDPRWVVEDPSGYHAMRAALRAAEYLVLAAG